MELDVLTAISPIDGRYRGKSEALADYFSEYALIRYRVRVEIEYFITLCELPLPQLQDFDHSLFEKLRDIYRNFTIDNARRVKEIEKTTNHDVKAVEYFIKEELDKIGSFDAYKEFIHFGLTSQDINNTSVPLSIKDALANVYIPQVEELIALLRSYAEEWNDIPMLAKTHGQPASPTRLGKEIMVFVYRLEQQLESLKQVPVTAKFGGATGNYNAHHVAYPDYDWKAFGNRFVSCGDPGNGGLMHLDRLGDVVEDHGLHRLFPIFEEVLLLLHDAVGHLQQGLIPALQALDEPLGLLQVGADELTVAAVAGIARHGRIGLVDADLRHRVGIQLHHPLAIFLADGHVGNHILGFRLQHAVSRARLQVQDQIERLLEVPLFKLHLARQGAVVAIAEQIHMLFEDDFRLA